MALKYQSLRDSDLIPEIDEIDVNAFGLLWDERGRLQAATYQHLRDFFTRDVHDRIDALETTSAPSFWPQARSFTLTGVVTGTGSTDGRTDLEITTTINPGSIAISDIADLSDTLAQLDQTLAQKLDADDIADSAHRLATPRSITLTGPVQAQGVFDGSQNLALLTSIPENALSIYQVEGLSQELANRMFRGSFGLGGDAWLLETFDDFGLSSMFGGVVAEVPDGPEPGSVLMGFTTSYAGIRLHQFLISETGRIYARAATIGQPESLTWHELLHTGNFDPDSKLDAAVGDALVLDRGELGATVDLDTVVSTGIYFQRTAEFAQGGTNYPVDEPGVLSVFTSREANNHLVYQTYHDGTLNRIFTRVRTLAGIWSPWTNVTEGSGNSGSAGTVISGGKGLTGGGDLTQDRTIELGTPSSVSATSTNTVTTDSHTHNLTMNWGETEADQTTSPADYPANKVSLTRVGSATGLGWPQSGMAVTFATYSNRHAQIYFGSDTNRLFFRTAVSNQDSWRNLEEIFHTGNQLALGTTAAAARTALGLGPLATADDTTVVRTTGNQTVAGTKTLTGNLVVTGRSIFIDSSGDPADGNDNRHLYFRDADGTTRGMVYSDGTSRNMVMRRFGTDGVQDGDLVIRSATELTFNNQSVWYSNAGSPTNLPTQTAGFSLGSTMASSPTDISRHLALHSTAYGFSVTSNRLNYNSGTGPSGQHVFLVNKNERLIVGDAELTYGSDSDAVTDTRTVRVQSNGFAGFIASGDVGDTSGEPGGGFFAAVIDGPGMTGNTTTFMSAINSAGSDGMGGTWTDTVSNSGLIAVRGNFRLQLGTNDQIAMYVQGANATFNGTITSSGNISSSGTISDSSGNLRTGINERVPSSRTITAGNGLSGGGALDANRTITLGTPGAITPSSTNSVSATSHTHSLDRAAAYTWTGTHTFSSSVNLNGTINGRMTIGNDELSYGISTDAVTALRTVRVISNGFAGFVANGDVSNTSGEPGGGFFAAVSDGRPITGGSCAIWAFINSANSDGMGGTWTGTVSNSGLLGVRGNFPLHIGSNAQIALTIQGQATRSNGNITAPDFVISSDRSLKREIVDLTVPDDQWLQPRHYYHTEHEQYEDGFVAQEVQLLYPDAVVESDGLLFVKYPRLTAALAAQDLVLRDQIREQASVIDQLQQEMSELKEQMARLIEQCAR